MTWKKAIKTFDCMISSESRKCLKEDNLLEHDPNYTMGTTVAYNDITYHHALWQM